MLGNVWATRLDAPRRSPAWRESLYSRARAHDPPCVREADALLRVAWDTVGRIVERVVADHLDERRLAGLVAIGCDELSYRRGQRYLTNVADHASGRILWSSPGRNAQTLQGFFGELGEPRPLPAR